MGELGRRLVHASGVIGPLLYLFGPISWNQLRGLLLFGLVVTAILEALRLYGGLEWWIYDHLTRPYEAENVAGYGLYMISITLVALVFEPPVAIPAMLMLMLGDPVSGYLGSGELKRMKSPVAMLGMFVVCFLVTLPFTVLVFEWGGWALGVAAVGAAAGTIADAVKPRINDWIIDDNLTIPVAAAVVLWAAYELGADLA